LPLSQIVKAAGSDLTDIGVERSIAIGKKGHELSVSRNCGIAFRAGKVGQRRESCVRQGIGPPVIGSVQVPTDEDNNNYERGNWGDPSDPPPR
jgi:hypothetical protein